MNLDFHLSVLDTQNQNTFIFSIFLYIRPWRASSISLNFWLLKPFSFSFSWLGREMQRDKQCQHTQGLYKVIENRTHEYGITIYKAWSLEHQWRTTSCFGRELHHHWRKRFFFVASNPIIVSMIPPFSFVVFTCFIAYKLFLGLNRNPTPATSRRTSDK